MGLLSRDARTCVHTYVICLRPDVNKLGGNAIRYRVLSGLLLHSVMYVRCLFLNEVEAEKVHCVLTITALVASVTDQTRLFFTHRIVSKYNVTFCREVAPPPSTTEEDIFRVVHSRIFRQVINYQLLSDNSTIIYSR